MATNYNQRLHQAITYIGQHLDEEIRLELLSEAFYISKFHFHRLFTAFTGLSLQQYVRWLRLKRAAYQLIFDKNKSIINIAIDAGFESHEAFSRAFKKACGLSPSQYRQGSDTAYWDQQPYCLPKPEDKDMKVELRQVKQKRLAMVEHRGDYRLLPEAVSKLIEWAQAQPISLKPKAGEAFAFAYDDPQTTESSKFRFDLGICIPENFKLDKGTVVEKKIPSGRYAVVMHKGSRKTIGETIHAFYREWLPTSEEELGDLPCVFCYYNFDHEVAETEALTECWFLLK